jgi:hypothetical protein
MIATNVYGYATTIADLQTWRTLPRYYAVARIPTPENGRVRLSGPAGDHEVDVPLNRNSMVVLRSLRAGGPAAIHVFPLDPIPSFEVAVRTEFVTKGTLP